MQYTMDVYIFWSCILDTVLGILEPCCRNRIVLVSMCIRTMNN